MDTPLCRLGHVASLSELRRAGFTAPDIRALRKNPLCHQPRRGWYVCGDLNANELLAASCGGRIDCVSVLRVHGIWAGDVRGTLHLRMPAHGGRATQRLASSGRRVVTHWLRPRLRGSKLYVSVFDALRQAMDCLPADDLIAAIESAVHLKKLSRERAVDRVGAQAASKGAA